MQSTDTSNLDMPKRSFFSSLLSEKGESSQEIKENYICRLLRSTVRSIYVITFITVSMLYQILLY